MHDLLYRCIARSVSYSMDAIYPIQPPPPGPLVVRRRSQQLQRSPTLSPLIISNNENNPWYTHTCQCILLAGIGAAPHSSG